MMTPQGVGLKAVTGVTSLHTNNIARVAECESVADESKRHSDGRGPNGVRFMFSISLKRDKGCNGLTPLCGVES